MTDPANSLASELPELIPLALVIALSPLSIIPGILMLHTPRPRPTSLSFLVGWVLGIAVVTGAFVGGSEMSTGLNKAPPWAHYGRIVLGTALIVWGLYRWLTRDRSEHMPKWLTSMTSLGSHPRARAARRLDETPPQKIGHELPATFSNRPAPASERASVAATSASSCSSETCWRTRASCPASSSAAM